MLLQWLEFQPDDDEKTRAKKKKLAKSYKSKLRFHKMDTETKVRQSSWLDFQKGKGTKKKAGFFTGAQPFMRTTLQKVLMRSCQHYDVRTVS